MSERKSILLRLDPAVHDALARWAGDELRSTNAQIEFLLRRALADAGRQPSRLRRCAGPVGRRAAAAGLTARAAGQVMQARLRRRDYSRAMENEEPPRRRGFRTGRLEAFSDGVFAIAITLLVLDIAVSGDAGQHLLLLLVVHFFPAVSYQAVRGLYPPGQRRTRRCGHTRPMRRSSC